MGENISAHLQQSFPANQINRPCRIIIEPYYAVFLLRFKKPLFFYIFF